MRRCSGLEACSHRKHRHAIRRHYCVQPWAEHMEIYWGEGAQAYVTPISAEQVCVVVLAERFADADFQTALANWPELKERLAGAQLGSRERGAITSMHTLRRVSAANVALVGDASGGVDAITGEGLRLSFRQAFALAKAMDSGDLMLYERAHRELARKPKTMTKLMLMLGRHDSLRERAIRGMAARPQVFEKLLAIHVGYRDVGAVHFRRISTGLAVPWRLNRERKMCSSEDGSHGAALPVQSSASQLFSRQAPRLLDSRPRRRAPKELLSRSILLSAKLNTWWTARYTRFTAPLI